MSCLFLSLSRFIDGLNETSLRGILCDYMASDPIIMEQTRLSEYLKLENMNLDQYVQWMRNPATWGGAIEINAFCNLFKAKVVVQVKNHHRIIEFKPYNDRYQSEFTIFWDGGHYEPVITRSC